jgi:hypothetical protein
MVSTDDIWQHYEHLDVGGYARQLLADVKQAELEDIAARGLAYKQGPYIAPPISSADYPEPPYWYEPGSNGWMMAAVEKLKTREWTMDDAIAAFESGTKLCL